MSYTENYQKWLDFAELPAYLHDELVKKKKKTKEDGRWQNTNGNHFSQQIRLLIWGYSYAFTIEKVNHLI